MGVINQGILGGVSGKVGPVVGSSWKGINYLKAMPTSVANPRTASQVAQRDKFSFVVAFAVTILASVIKPLRDRFAVKMSGFNSFVQDNIDLFAAEMPSPAADLVIASGKMAATSINNATAGTGTKIITVEWTDDTGEGYKLATDKAYIVVVNETNEEIAISSGESVRSDVTENLEFDSNIGGADVLQAYLVFLRADGTVVSNTAYKLGDWL